jgi:hypothetical protein
LSDAFIFEEHDKQGSGSDQEGGLEMKSVSTKNVTPADAGADESNNSCAIADDEPAVDSTIVSHGPITNPT